MSESGPLVYRRARAGWVALHGQSTVEVVALLPALAMAALAVLQVLAAGLAAELADHSAEAGAVAIIQDRDPEDAARKAVPGWSRARLTVEARGRVVRVTIRPQSLFPGLGDLLKSTARADAGPKAAS